MIWNIQLSGNAVIIRFSSGQKIHLIFGKNNKVTYNFHPVGEYQLANFVFLPEISQSIIVSFVKKFSIIISSLYFTPKTSKLVNRTFHPGK